MPTSDYSFEDVIVMSRARDMKIPFPGDIVEIERTIEKLGLNESQRDAELCKGFLRLSNTDRLDIITFGELLQVDLKNTDLHKLFALLDHVSLWMEYLLCCLFQIGLLSISLILATIGHSEFKELPALLPLLQTEEFGSSDLPACPHPCNIIYIYIYAVQYCALILINLFSIQ